MRLISSLILAGSTAVITACAPTPSAAPETPAAEPDPAPAPQAASAKGDKKGGPSPSTLRHAAKKAEERMASMTEQLARLDDDLANAAVSDPGRLEGLTRARAKAQSDLDAAEAEWLKAEEALAEVA